MQALHIFYSKLIKPRRHVTLEQALLGANVSYLAYRFRYFFVNNILETSLHLFEFYLLGMLFNTPQFFGLILLRAATIVIKSAWWGALEALRERMRHFKLSIHETEIAKELTCWLHIACCIAGIILLLGIIWLFFFLQPSLEKYDERLGWYGFAILLQLSADIIIRVIHSGIFATQRIYRPFWTVLATDIAGFIVILALLPVARAWCLPASYVVTASLALYLTWHYSCTAYSLHCKKILTTVTWREFLIWSKKLPINKVLLATLAGAVMGLEGILLWLFRPFANDNPELFKLIYLLSPQIRTGFSWARMCYFDLKKLSAPKWQIFINTFTRYLFAFSIIIGVVCWIISTITCRLFLPEFSFFILLGLLPLFIGWPILALRQMQFFAGSYYNDVLFSTSFLGCIIIVANFFKPEAMLILLFLAIYITIIIAIRPHFSASPISPVVNFTPIYLHLDYIRNYKNKMILIYFEITQNIDSERNKELLEHISVALGHDKLSNFGNKSFLCSITHSITLQYIKNIIPGFSDFFYSTNWQNNGLEAIKKSYVLRKRIFNFNEMSTIDRNALEHEFFVEFPSAIIINMEAEITRNLSAKRKDKKACQQIVSAVNKAWISLPFSISINKYTAFIYWSEDKKLIFICHPAKETRRRLQYWKRQLWQFSIENISSPLE